MTLSPAVAAPPKSLAPFLVDPRPPAPLAADHPMGSRYAESVSMPCAFVFPADGSNGRIDEAPDVPRHAGRGRVTAWLRRDVRKRRDRATFSGQVVLTKE